MLHAGEITCPGSSVGSEYLTTNQRVGGSSPSQDTIFSTKDFLKESRKGVDKQEGILYHCTSRRKAASEESKRVQKFRLARSFWRTGSEKALDKMNSMRYNDKADSSERQ